MWGRDACKCPQQYLQQHPLSSLQFPLGKSSHPQNQTSLFPLPSFSQPFLFSLPLFLTFFFLSLLFPFLLSFLGCLHCLINLFLHFLFLFLLKLEFLKHDFLKVFLKLAFFVPCNFAQCNRNFRDIFVEHLAFHFLFLFLALSCDENSGLPSCIHKCKPQFLHYFILITYCLFSC